MRDVRCWGAERTSSRKAATSVDDPELTFEFRLARFSGSNARKAKYGTNSRSCAFGSFPLLSIIGARRLNNPQSRLEGIHDTRRLQLLIDAIVDYAIYMIDVDGTVRSWNSGAERLKGYSADEIIGKSFSSFYSPEDRAKGLPQTALRIAAETGRFSSEGWRVRKDGSRFWAFVVVDAIRDEQGQVIGFAKVTRDITERQQAHNELLESERRYRRLIEAVVDYAIFQLDPAGNVTTWNPGAQRIKGYDPDEIIGQHFSQFYTPEDIQLGVPKLALAEAAKQGRFEAEGWRMRKDGSRFWASVVIDRITDEAGELVGFAKVTRDVTERKQAQDELQRVQQQLAASQKLEAVGQLSGGIAHDFNNLLMIVLGNLETAERNSRGLANSHESSARTGQCQAGRSTGSSTDQPPARILASASARPAAYQSE